ncbi:MAG TPA: carboxypeptidase regulatory-like domain-containing protein [Pyrinomonadaceae bacterium]
MNFIQRTIKLSLGLALILALSATAGFAQQGTGSLRGQITDELGGAIVGATVTVVNESGVERSVQTNDEGVYVITGLAPGSYTVRAAMKGFAISENPDVRVEAGRRGDLDLKLGVAIEEQQVTVADQRNLSTESESNADALVLRGKDLEALPEDPDDLAAALTALAGPSAGPNGGQIYIDGFTGGRLPPKEAIREVRINQNPLNAENDRPGFGRIDILTRPGFDKLRGSASMTFNDESMNARNPFAPERAPFQQRVYGFTLSGPVVAKKASFFLDFQRREEDDNDIINAVILDPSLNPVRFNQAILQPRRNTTFSPRFDYAINQNHTVVARYTYSHFQLENAGVGNFSLPTQAFTTANTQHTVQLTETAVINPKWINETRFQYIRTRSDQEGSNSTAPTVNVLEAFTTGGSPVGLSFNNENRWELQNYTTATLGSKHVLRFGVRLRGVRITDVSPQNFNGTFTFAGGSAPRLDANNQVVIDPSTGQPFSDPITSIERYRRTLFLQRQGFTTAQIIARGGGASQFSIAGGNPEASVSQTDFGGFIQDEWRYRPNLTFTFGLRYENQSNISSNLNFAPRIFFAWAPGGNTTGQIGQFGAGQPKFVIRGGFGIFYDRFVEGGTLDVNRFNGANQLRFNVGPSALGNVVYNQDGTISNVPTTASLTAFAQPQVTNRLAENLKAPYSMLGAINVERQLPYGITAFAVLFTYRTRHAFVLRDINAPVPGSITAANPNGVRPLGAAAGEVYQWESSGVFNDIRLQLGARKQLTQGLSLFFNYQTGKAQSNTDCVFGQQGGCYPADPYNLAADYGRVAFFPRHNFFIGGSLAIPRLKIGLNPFIVARTGRFFNITTGRDTNGDKLFRERPAFASSSTRPEDLRVTPFGDFDVNPAPGVAMIPRNYGEGPGFFSVNLGISRTFGFGDLPGANRAAAAPQGGGGGGARPGGGRPGGAPGGPAPAAAAAGGQRPGGGPGGGPGGPEKRYNLTFSVNIQNLFNRTNLNTPVGNLSSPLFGQSLSTLGGFGGGGNPAAGNRRVSATVRFNF